MTHRALAFAITGWLVAGCATPVSMDRQALVRLFADLRQTPHKEPVIIVPGALGSILCEQDTGHVVWGRSGGHSIAELALPIDGATWRDNRDQLIPVGLLQRMTVVPHVAEFKVIEETLGALSDAGGYIGGDLTRPQPGSSCFLFAYDWRRDVVEAAQQLGAAIERLTERLGDPHLKVHLICQSLGGLVARYYVKYGTADVLDQEPLPAPTYAGAQHVAQVIMLGTPNNGSVEAFRSLHEGFHVTGIGQFPPEVVFTMPAVYELLPHEEETVFLDRDGQPMEVSLWDPHHWETYGWSVFNPNAQAERRHELIQQYDAPEGTARFQRHVDTQRRFLASTLARARKFQRALDQGDPAKDPVQYVLLGSDCLPTLQRALLVQEDANWRTRFNTKDPALQARLFGPGDRSVTKESLLGSHYLDLSHEALAFSTLHVAYAVFVCERHLRLTQNSTVLDNLLHALLVQEATAQHRAVCLYCQGQAIASQAQAPSR